MRVVIDTNVLLSSLRSRRGASHRLLQHLGSPLFTPVISTPLCLEYEDVLHRPGLVPNLDTQDIDDFLDYFLSECLECEIYFLWRPFLSDIKDDMVLELALSGKAPYIISHNTRDFRSAAALGIQAVTPATFQRMLSLP